MEQRIPPLDEFINENIINEAAKVALNKYMKAVENASDWSDYDAKVTKTKTGFSYEDYDGNFVDVIYKGSYVTIDKDKYTFDEFLDLLTGGDEDMIADVTK